MIDYDSNSLCSLFKIEGSIIPKAVWFAIPSATVGVLLNLCLHHEFSREYFMFLEEINQSISWSALSIVLGMLLGVRTNKAYARFWEGITLVQQMRAEWFEASSNLIAFSIVAAKKDQQMEAKVTTWQYTLVRLMSLMHGAALRQIGGNEEEFDVLDIQSLDEETQRYLAECEHTDVNCVEVILHWIQVLVTDSVTDGVIVVPAPILTRAYQTLSRGMVNLHNARKLADVPFPFPLSQITMALLVTHSVMTPFVIAGMTKYSAVVILICFLPIFGMWGIMFVAGELEQPFGSDPNDLPLSVLQYEFNTSLLMLLDPEVNRSPSVVAAKMFSVEDLKDALAAGELTKTNWVYLHYTVPQTNGERMPSVDTDSSRRSRSKNIAARSPAGGSHHSKLAQRQKNMRQSQVRLDRRSRISTYSMCSRSPETMSPREMEPAGRLSKGAAPLTPTSDHVATGSLASSINSFGRISKHSLDPDVGKNCDKKLHFDREVEHNNGHRRGTDHESSGTGLEEHFQFQRSASSTSSAPSKLDPVPENEDAAPEVSQCERHRWSLASSESTRVLVAALREQSCESTHGSRQCNTVGNAATGSGTRLKTCTLFAKPRTPRSASPMTTPREWRVDAHDMSRARDAVNQH